MTTPGPRPSSDRSPIHDPEVSAPTAISMYSGAGGLDLGFQQAGFALRWANDVDALAVETYRTNLGPHAVCGDVVATPLPEVTPTVLLGGPPCQGFSVAGRMDAADPRSRHVFHFMDAVQELAPRAFVMENVKALASNPRWAHVRTRLLERARALGYATEIYVLNAADFEVPQARERMFMVGVRDHEPIAPTPVSATAPPSVRDALETLPSYGTPGNDTRCVARVVPAAKPVMRPTAHQGSLLFNGSGRPLDLDRPAKTLPASMGGNATPIIDQDELALGASPWVVEYHAALKAGQPPLRRAPERMRRLTVEEAAALQTFPREFTFCGPVGARFRQIGNAVPPRLAYHVALAVRQALAHAPGEISSPVAALAA